MFQTTNQPSISALSSSFQFFPVLSGSFRFFPVHSGSFQFFPALSSSFQFFPLLSSAFRSLPVLFSSFRSFPVLSSSFRFFPVLSSSFQFFSVLSGSFRFFLWDFTKVPIAGSKQTSQITGPATSSQRDSSCCALMRNPAGTKRVQKPRRLTPTCWVSVPGPVKHHERFTR